MVVQSGAEVLGIELSNGAVAGVRLANGELIDARQLILTDEGHEAMERLRGTIRELELSELAALIDAVGQTEQIESRIMPLLAGLLGLLADAYAETGNRLFAARAALGSRLRGRAQSTGPNELR